MTAQQVLTKYWGYSSFRPLQEDIIHSVLSGKDTLALMPTGGGKSICFQVPGMMKDGVCLVISPLLALMKDQVDELLKRDIKAVSINSAMTKREIDITLDNCVYGNIKFLYVSPERLTNEVFIARVRRMKINLIAVDEAHCISQWGYDFRPSYLKIAELKQMIPGVPVLAMTASAVKEVVEDIQEKLEFKKKNLLSISFERKNLAYVVLKEENKLSRLLNIVTKVKGTGIVYVRNRKKTEDVAKYLREHSIKADFYHAGLAPAIRENRQNNWQKNITCVIVCTNAFGMGINKSDVRFVVHLDLPDGLEAYFQEAGRAGRDEKKAYATLLYNDADRLELEKSVADSFPELEEIKRVYTALGNYYRLAVGAGAGQTFDFDIGVFSNQYNLKPLLVHNSFKFLEREGYISISDSFFQPSRVMVTMSKEELYRFQVEHKILDSFIKLLLRTYPGLFTAYSKITESDLAFKGGIKKTEVTDFLNQLHQQKVLEYIPQTMLPQLTFITERLDEKNLLITKQHYTNLKEKAISRMEWMIHYASSDHKCRSQLLLSYFGETDTYRCGVCDVCLERNKLDLNSVEFENVSEQVKKILHQEPMMLNDVVHAVQNSREDKTIKVIQWLLDNGKLRYDEEHKLVWVK